VASAPVSWRVMSTVTVFCGSGYPTLLMDSEGLYEKLIFPEGQAGVDLTGRPCKSRQSQPSRTSRPCR
jgi:hypothetical protein